MGKPLPTSPRDAKAGPGLDKAVMTTANGSSPTELLGEYPSTGAPTNGASHANGANGHHANGANGHAKPAVPAPEAVAAPTFFSFGKRPSKAAVSTSVGPPVRRAESQASEDFYTMELTDDATGQKQWIRGRRWSGIVHANGTHRECFAEDEVAVFVDTVTEKIVGISVRDWSPPASPSSADDEDNRQPGRGARHFKFPIPKADSFPASIPASQLPLFNQRMDRPLLAMAAYSLLHVLAARGILPHVPAAHMKGKERTYLAEKLPSTVNALFVGSLGLYCVVKKGILWGNGVDKLKAWGEELDWLFAGHLGFTVYDTYIMAVLGGDHYSVWAHHVLGILGAVAVRAFKTLAWFPTCFTPSELTVVPSNLLWIQQRLWPGKRDVEAKLLAARAVLFTFFRLPNAAVAVLGALSATRRDPGLVKRATKEIPPLVLLLCAFNTVVFGGLNLWWTQLVFKAAVRHRRETAGKAVGVHHI
ncbi:hypothetical protein DFJ74DRAFT_643759 [Hyaloraphidium curvatum]|nr:hypothetical protein DFJ74DRAFT_643759 [Hyaloraphidium curvatum]